MNRLDTILPARNSKLQVRGASAGRPRTKAQRHKEDIHVHATAEADEENLESRKAGKDGVSPHQLVMSSSLCAMFSSRCAISSSHCAMLPSVCAMLSLRCAVWRSQ